MFNLIKLILKKKKEMVYFLFDKLKQNLGHSINITNITKQFSCIKKLTPERKYFLHMSSTGLNAWKFFCLRSMQILLIMNVFHFSFDCISDSRNNSTKFIFWSKIDKKKTNYYLKDKISSDVVNNCLSINNKLCFFFSNNEK